MPRKPTPSRGETPRRGRPPQRPRTTFARWLQKRNLTVKGTAEKMRLLCSKLDLPKRAAPRAKTLLDATNGRHFPAPATILLVREFTGGDVDLEHWVRDIGV